MKQEIGCETFLSSPFNKTVGHRRLFVQTDQLRTNMFTYYCHAGADWKMNSGGGGQKKCLLTSVNIPWPCVRDPATDVLWHSRGTCRGLESGGLVLSCSYSAVVGVCMPVAEVN